MQIFGGMQYKILERFASGMKGMKGYTCIEYFRWKVMPTFEYDPLFLSLEPKTLDEEEDKGDTSGVGPSDTITTKEEPGDLKGRKESLNREAIGKTCIKQSWELLKFVVQDINSHEYASTIIKMGE